MGKILFAWVLAAFLAGCGGGGGSGTPDPGGAPPPQSGASFESRTLKSDINGTTYRLGIYLPPAERGARATLPVVYVLDGEARFDAVVSIVEAERLPLIVVAIQTEGLRNVDYVPANTCTGGGGGNAGYLQFLRTQVTPLIESTFGGDPAKRILLGHSHGGSFVYYALFAQAPEAHHFHAYLASDASIWCLPATGFTSSGTRARVRSRPRAALAVSASITPFWVAPSASSASKA